MHIHDLFCYIYSKTLKGVCRVWKCYEKYQEKKKKKKKKTIKGGGGAEEPVKQYGMEGFN